MRHTIKTAVGTFSGSGDQLHHETLPVLMLAGYRIMAGDATVSETATRIVFAGNKSLEITPKDILAEAARLDAVRTEYAIQWRAYDDAMSKWYAGLQSIIDAVPRPQMRMVKRGRKIRRSEGRATALDTGFDPSLHGMYHPDPADKAMAELEYKEAYAEYERAIDVARREYAMAHPQPTAPTVPSPACSAEIVAKFAGLFGWVAPKS